MESTNTFQLDSQLDFQLDFQLDIQLDFQFDKPCKVLLCKQAHLLIYQAIKSELVER